MCTWCSRSHLELPTQAQAANAKRIRVFTKSCGGNLGGKDLKGVTYFSIIRKVLLGFSTEPYT